MGVGFTAEDRLAWGQGQGQWVSQGSLERALRNPSVS